LIAAALDGALDPVDQAAVSLHLRDCVACRAVAADYAADTSHLRDVAAVAPPAWVAALVIEAARRTQPVGGRSWAPARSRLLATLVGVALLVALAVVLAEALR
jgi:predicted anti-sigma-YlaC factor YlaD